MPRHSVMKHLINRDNIGLVFNRNVQIDFAHALISDNVIDLHVLETGLKGAYLAPLYIYPDEQKEDIFASDEREYNIASGLLDRFSRQWPQFQPEQLFYYVYAVLHSNQYRARFAQYLRMDFPRLPFTDDYQLFTRLAEMGKELAGIHLLKSPRLNPPVARYQGGGSNDLVESIRYDERKHTVRINPDKHFEGITPELWNYHIGGYQVLHKYLKDRRGKTLSDPIHYCRMATALHLTIETQAAIDKEMGDLLDR